MAFPWFNTANAIIFDNANDHILSNDECPCDQDCPSPTPRLSITLTWTDSDHFKCWSNRLWQNGDTWLICGGYTCKNTTFTTLGVTYKQNYSAFGVNETPQVPVFTGSLAGGLFSSAFTVGQVFYWIKRATVKFVNLPDGASFRWKKKQSYLSNAGSPITNTTTTSNASTGLAGGFPQPAPGAKPSGGSVTTTTGITIAWALADSWGC